MMKRRISIYVLLFITMFVSFVGLKFIAYSLPTDLVKAHVIESCNMLNEEGLYAQVGYKTNNSNIKQQVDTWTDAIYMDVAYRIGSHNIFEEIAADYIGKKGVNPLERLNNTIIASEENESFYGRQWFGAMSYIRPLLLLFNLAEIRYIMQFIFWGLFLYTVMRLYESIDKKIAYSYAISLLCVSPFAIPFSFNIFNSFLVIFIIILIICNTHNRIDDMGIYVFVTGGLTAYFDLFLTPFITFGIVSIIVMYIEWKKGKTFNLFTSIITLCRCMFFWLLGYLGLWISKWLYASLILGNGFLKNVLNEIKNVSNGTVSWGPDSTLGYIIASLKNNSSRLFPYNIYDILQNEFPTIMSVFLLLVSIYIIFFWWKHKKPWNEMYFGLSIFLIAISPYIYYIIMHFHTYVHSWVEYRYQMITIMGLIIAYLSTIDYHPKINKRNSDKNE